MSQAYYALLECLAQDHIAFIAQLEPQVFVYILTTISEGLTSLGQYILTTISEGLTSLGQ